MNNPKPWYPAPSNKLFPNIFDVTPTRVLNPPNCAPNNSDNKTLDVQFQQINT